MTVRVRSRPSCTIVWVNIRSCRSRIPIRVASPPLLVTVSTIDCITALTILNVFMVTGATMLVVVAH